MPTYAKVTMKFGGLKWGWEEDFYWFSAANNDLGSLRLDTKSLITVRRSFLGTTWSLEAARMELVTSTGASFITGTSVIGYQRVGGGPGLYAGDCSNPWTCVLARGYDASSAYARNFYWRGIPDDKLCINGNYKVPFPFPAGLKTKLDAYVNFLIKDPDPEGINPKIGRFCLRAIDKPSGRGQAVRVVDVQVLTGGRFKITVAVPVTHLVDDVPVDVGIGDQIHVHNATDPSLRGLNGTWTIQDISDANTILTLDAVQKRECAVHYNMKAVAWGISHKIFPLVSMDLSRITVRKTGEPFFGTRGRRRKC